MQRTGIRKAIIKLVPEGRLSFLITNFNNVSKSQWSPPQTTRKPTKIATGCSQGYSLVKLLIGTS
jgi:hypothetical protein